MNKGYTSKTMASKWEEGLITGNGTIGAVAMGFPAKEKVIFSHEWLYAPLHPRRTPVHTAETLSEIRALLKAGKYQEAANFVVEQGKKEGFPNEMDWTDPFVPACTLAVDLKMDGEPAAYEKSVNFENGLTAVSFKVDGCKIERELFVSRADRIAVMRIRSSEPASYEIRLEKFTEIDGPNRWWEEHYDRNIDTPKISVKGDTILYDGIFKTVDYGYRCAAKVAKTDGCLSETGNGILVEGAVETVLYFNVVMCDCIKEPEVSAEAAFNGIDPDFDTLLASHAAIHGGIYNRISLELGDPESDGQLAEELWARSRKEGTPPPNGFFKRVFDAGRYEILCASGETPPNLQGIWAGTNQPCWSGDYTQNGNLQTAILCNLPGNMFEMMDSFVNYEEYLVPDNKVNAETLYGCRGMMLACRGNRSGLLNHFGHRWCMTFWTAGAAWNSHFFYDYYLYSGDREFFVNHALPYMKECALFYEDFLIEDENGHWFFTPSYSPENNPVGSEAQACVNATMDVAVASELFQNLIEGCKTLGVEEENILKWQSILDKMPPYQINEDGALKEWMTPDLKDRYDHRHSSHLYLLYYGLPALLRENRELYDACEKAYQYRMKYKEGEKGQMAFGNVQMAFSAAHLKDNETVWNILCEMAQNNYYNTFSSSHDMGPEIFNTDISGGFPALMLEALIQSRQVTNADGKIVSYEIELLPNLPQAWSKGHLKGVRARGGFELDFAWEDGKVVSCEVTNHCGNQYTLIGA
ncbi:MAG: hypothetical protein HFJ85_00470 [Oscillospiraceae bacterium]|nr:hypothetical protein [Oscillospiraceae bacterium]